MGSRGTFVFPTASNPCLVRLAGEPELILELMLAYRIARAQSNIDRGGLGYTTACFSQWVATLVADKLETVVLRGLLWDFETNCIYKAT